MEQHNEIYSRRLRAGSRTYFFDVKVNSRNDKYLVITESRKTGANLFQHDRIMVFEENLPNFLHSLYTSLRAIGIDVSNPPSDSEQSEEISGREARRNSYTGNRVSRNHSPYHRVQGNAYRPTSTSQPLPLEMSHSSPDKTEDFPEKSD